MTSLPGSTTPVGYLWSFWLPSLRVQRKGWHPRGGLLGIPPRPLAMPLSPHSEI